MIFIIFSNVRDGLRSWSRLREFLRTHLSTAHYPKPAFLAEAGLCAAPPAQREAEGKRTLRRVERRQQAKACPCFKEPLETQANAQLRITPRRDLQALDHLNVASAESNID